MLELKFKKLIDCVEIPVKNDGNIGIDLKCYISTAVATRIGEEKAELDVPAWERRIFSTGLAVDIPEGYAIIFKDRSGLAAKHGIHVLAGVIDSSYTGELLVCLLNTSDKVYTFRDGDKICQMVLVPDYEIQISEVSKLKETERGDKGFGSSGR